MGKEALPSLCPPGFEFVFNLIRFMPLFVTIFYFICLIMKHEIGVFLELFDVILIPLA